MRQTNRHQMVAPLFDPPLSPSTGSGPAQTTPHRALPEGKRPETATIPLAVERVAVERVAAHHLVTLHYRLAREDGTVLISTFESTPATLQLGDGTLAPAFERLLVGLAVGSRHTFVLEPEAAFGPRRAELVERVRRSDFPADETVEVGTILRFAAPDGSSYAGVVTQLTDEWGEVDFNHPLAGKRIIFEVAIIGVC